MDSENSTSTVQLLRRSRLAVGEGQEGVGGHEVRVAFEPAVVGVDPRAVGLLAAGELLGQLAAPVVLHSLGVFDPVDPEGVEGLGEDVVVVIESGAAQAGIRLKIVVLADPAGGEIGRASCRERV